MLKRMLASVLVVVALSGAACGGDDDDDGAVPTGDAPDAGEPSTRFQVPLPEDAVAEPASVEGEGEAFRVKSDATLLDVNAFYEQQIDGKPIGEFAWCGGAGFPDGRIVRIWKKAETHQLQLDLVGEESGVLIRIKEDAAAAASTCPPSPPVEQPFEGP